MKPEVFVAWRDTALGFLAAERSDEGKLLSRAESQNPTNGTAEEERGVSSAGVPGDIWHISRVIFESLKMIMSDTLLSRVAKLHAEWRGSAPRVIAMRSGRKYQDPQR